ncbi:MAG: glycoside hydrolase family 99-like domain-containing protein [Armatimonadetes bacterium]|nr:glycoside hydrolase family 99-like domain-containing protein [Armatimonadota bacterium]MDW8122499.1 glycoside hydrolase family 99-like domain-containing protein [Armatimonadota bacterium]
MGDLLALVTQSANSAWLWWCLLLFVLLLLAGDRPRQWVLIQWDFAQKGEFAGWRPSPEVLKPEVTDGVLRFDTTGNDPIWEYSLPFEISAQPWQAIEIRLKADRDGMAEFFWSNTTEPPHGGFRPDKRTPFWVKGDNRWHLYRLFPFWHTEGKIIRLRFDPFGGGRFEVDFIRIVEWIPPSPTNQTTFSFSHTLSGWQPLGEITVAPTADGALLQTDDPDAFLISPPLQIKTEASTYATLELTTQGEPYATFLFATDRQPGLHALTFPVVPDERRHTYNLDLLSHPSWSGRVLAIGLRPPEKSRLFVVHYASLSSAPSGPADPRVIFFGLEEGILRVGQAGTLTLHLTNTGGAPARFLFTPPQLPTGVSVLESSFTNDHNPPGPQSLPTINPGDDFVAQVKFSAHKEMNTTLSYTLQFQNAPSLTVQTQLQVLPRLSQEEIKKLKDPTPVRGPYEIGVYYFPGWKTWSQWRPIFRFLHRKPLLGWYQEGDPTVADWHIRWAVEHGITFFAYDWYWERGARQLEHALHDGYFQSSYRDLLKFCLLWANHNTPGSSSFDDCLAVTRYWINNYFKRPQYLRFQGKPVIIIFSRRRLADDLTSEGVRKALDAMRQLCQQEGLPGLYVIACIDWLGETLLAGQEGYDAVTCYNWPHLGLRGQNRWADFESLIEGYRRYWEEIVNLSPIPLFLPLCGGWDSRPWQGHTAVVRFGRDPQSFRKHLQDARNFLDKWVPTGKVLPFAIIEAWNEWGEGSYIEPHQEFSFAYLDAIRDTFFPGPTHHRDLVPADLGQSVPQATPLWDKRTSWDFDDPADTAWTQTMNIAQVQISDGLLKGITVLNDPAFFGPPMVQKASQFSFVHIRMRLTPTARGPFQDVGQIFWQTQTINESEATSVRFPVFVDGRWHEYKLCVSDNPRWQGIITRLRLDPCSRPDVLVEVDWIQMSP